MKFVFQIRHRICFQSKDDATALCRLSGTLFWRICFFIHDIIAFLRGRLRIRSKRMVPFVNFVQFRHGSSYHYSINRQPCNYVKKRTRSHILINKHRLFASISTVRLNYKLIMLSIIGNLMLKIKGEFLLLVAPFYFFYLWSYCSEIGQCT